MVAPVDPYVGSESAMSAADSILDTGSKHMKLTRRQKELNNYWSYFRVAEHEGKRVDWSGRPVMSRDAAEVISRDKFMPPGYEMTGDDLPRNCRRPIAPLGIVRNVVMRFTGLLFSNRRQPRVAVPGDDKTEDYLNAVLKDGGFWSAMVRARNYGGATGSACIGYRFVNGSAIFEALDPRFTTPEFAGRGYTEPIKLTVQYTYSREEQQDDGRWKTIWYWYRRVIDAQTDTVWVPVRCREKEPAWDFIQRNTVNHNLGFVPYEWIQNFPVDDEMDGDPDCMGCYEMITAVDELLSEVYQGTVANCFSADTEFVSADGVRSFEEMEDGDKVTVLTHKGNWKPATVRMFSTAPLRAVTFGRQSNTQTVRATGNHRWILQDGTVVTTDELKPGMKLWRPPHIVRDWVYEESSDEQKLYWAKGFLCGDGSVSRRDKNVFGTRVRLCGSKGRFLSRFVETGCSVTYPPSSNSEPTVYMRKYGKELPQLEDIGVENMTAFVRGLLDADGTRNTKHPEAADINPFQGIQATGSEMVEFIRRTFPAVGAYIVAEDDRTGDLTNYGVRKDETVYFSLVLGFSNSAVSPYIVRNIEYGGTEMTWCLVVEDDHSFVMPNGLVCMNCDPTLVINPGAEGGSISAIKKGSDNAIKLGTGGDAHYMELAGSGPQTGMTILKDIEERIYRQAQCVPDSVLFQNAGEKTATEIERIFSSMFEKADALREQYGPPIVRLGQKLLYTIRMYTAVQEVENPDGTISYFRGRVNVSPKVIQQADGDTVEIPRQIGKGTVCEVKWPAYQRASYTDQNTVSQIITTILTSDPKLMTRRTALNYLAPVMDFDPMQELHALKREEEQEANEAAMSEEEESEGGEEETPGSNPVSWKTALEAGIITLNEYREKALGLGEIPDGDLTMPQYHAKYAQTFVASTASVSEKSVDVATGKMQADEERAQESHDMKKEAHDLNQENRKQSMEAAKNGSMPPGQPGAQPTSSSNQPSAKPKKPASEPKE